MTREEFKVFLDRNMPFAVKASSKFSKYPFVYPFRSRNAQKLVKEALIRQWPEDKRYTEKDLQYAFIAGGKSSRNINNPGFDEVLEHLNNKYERK